MKIIVSFVLAVYLVLSGALLFAQDQPKDDVVQVKTNLVQIDAVVTDQNGNQVKTLTADDFELFQDSERQKITVFSYVDKSGETKANTGVREKTGKNEVIVPPSVRASGDNRTGRMITFIIDDGNCAATLGGMFAAREGLEKFVREQMQTNDSVAIYQTRSGSSLLQQYTSDKTQILRVVRKIRWLPALGACGSRSGDIFETARNDSLPTRNQGNFESDIDRTRRETSEDANRDVQTVGVLGVVRYVVRGLQRVSGRKTVIFMSDGLTLRGRNNDPRRALDEMRSLTELANRASVAFHTIDIRGLFNAESTNANDDISVAGEIDVARPGGTEKVTQDRREAVAASREGLRFLAEATGGNFYRDNNFLDVPVRRVLASESGYYLLAYQPDAESFKGKKFHQIDIKLKSKNLRVQSRAGFFSVTDEMNQPKKRSGDSELYEAITAPLPNSGINLRLSAFYGNSPTSGDFVRSLIHIDGANLTFVDDGNNKKASIDVIAVTLNEKNEVVDEFNRTHTFRIPAQGLSLVRANGLVYSTDVAVKKPGAYTFRVALRDSNSKKLGSTSQLLEVPSLKKANCFFPV